MSTRTRSRLRPLVLVGLLLALLVASPALVSAAPPPDMPQKLSELTAEQKSWRDADGVIWCSKHPQFPGCEGNPDTGYLYPNDDTLYRAQINNGAKETTIDLSPGTVADNTVGKAVDSAFGKAAESIGRFSGDLLVESMTWWIGTDSISLSYAGVMAGKAPVQKVVFFIMMAGILTSAMVMMVSRRTEPGAQVLLGGVKYVVISSMALIVLSGAIHAGDDFAHQMIDTDANQFGQRVQAMLGTSTIGNPGGVLLLGIVAFLLGAIQWVMGFIRQAGIIVLYNMILFAAAGQLTTWGRQWFPRIASTCVALVLYKPMAAFIYSLGFQLIGQEQSLTTLVTGLMVVALAVIALPAMLKFFDFMGMHVSGGSGALGVAVGGLAGGALGAAAAMGGRGSGSGSSSGGDGFANFMSATGPGGAGEHDPSPGNGGSQALTSGGGQPLLESGSSPKALGTGNNGLELEAGPGPQPENPDASGTPATPSDSGGSGIDVAGATEAGGAAAAGGGSMAAAGAAGAAATGGASMAIQAGLSAGSSAAEAADDVGSEMTGDDLGPERR
jgi:type IV secretion system protein TrbL